MSAHGIVAWTTLAAWLVVLVLIVAAIVRALREATRIGRRLDGLGDLPVMHAADRAQADMARLEEASTRLAPLLARAEVAIAAIRRGPVPDAFFYAVRRARVELAAFRAAARR